MITYGSNNNNNTKRHWSNDHVYRFRSDFWNRLETVSLELILKFWHWKFYNWNKVRNSRLPYICLKTVFHYAIYSKRIVVVTLVILLLVIVVTLKKFFFLVVLFFVFDFLGQKKKINNYTCKTFCRIKTF